MYVVPRLALWGPNSGPMTSTKRSGSAWLLEKAVAAMAAFRRSAGSSADRLAWLGFGLGLRFRLRLGLGLGLALACGSA